MGKIKTIVVLCNPGKPEAKEMAKKIRDWLSLKKTEYRVHSRIDYKVLKDGIYAVFVIGGDGSLLYVANKISQNNEKISNSEKIPIAGINRGGTKGHLCLIQADRIEPREVYKKIKQILQEEFDIEERTRIQAEIFRKTETEDKLIDTIDALNEIVIAGGPAKTVSLSLTIRDGEEIIIKDDPNRGDGIIFSTKTGSPAYNGNAGGIIIKENESDGFVITAIVPIADDASNSWLTGKKSVMFSTETTFEIHSRTKKKANLPSVVGDGQDTQKHKLKSDEYVVIKKSPRKTLFVKSKK